MVITLFSKKVNNPKGKYYYEIVLRGYKEKFKNVKNNTWVNTFLLLALGFYQNPRRDAEHAQVAS